MALSLDDDQQAALIKVLLYFAEAEEEHLYETLMDGPCTEHIYQYLHLLARAANFDMPSPDEVAEQAAEERAAQRRRSGLT